MALGTIVGFSGALANQNNTPPQPLTPEQTSKYALIAERQLMATDLIDEGQFAAAIPVLKSTFPIYRELGHKRYEQPYWLLSKAYRGLGEIQSALKAFKSGVYWVENDLSAPEVVADYSQFLAQQDNVQMSKLTFYSSYRFRLKEQSPKYEYVPLIVVFDHNANGDYLEFSPQHIRAACLMMESIYLGPDGEKACREAMALAPAWYYPRMQLATLVRENTEREALLENAYQLAKSDQERVWVQGVRGAMTHSKKEWQTFLKQVSDPVLERKKIALYEDKRLELAGCWQSIASEFAPLTDN